MLQHSRDIWLSSSPLPTPVASIDAIKALLAGGEPWRSYVSSASSAVDLRFAELDGTDLSGRSLTNCDLTGAQLRGANLDRANIADCVLDGAALTHASLVGATFDKVQCDGATFRGTSLRNFAVTRSRFAHVSFDTCALDSVRIRDCELISCTYSGLNARDIRLEQCDVTDLSAVDADIESGDISESVFHNWSHLGGHLKDLRFADCRLVGASFDKATVDNCAFRSCSIDSWRSHDASVHNLDLTDSHVRRTSIEDLGPTTAVLLNTAFIDCDWPSAAGYASWSGRYVLPPDLITHPVQDVRAIDPQLRRAIADAQYLRARIRNASTWKSRLLMRLWGLSSAFGQSLSRLLTVSVLVVALHAVALALLAWLDAVATGTLSTVDRWIALDLIGGAAADCGLAFIGANTNAVFPGATAVLLSCRILGLVALGMWVSVAANQIGKLSSQ